MTQFVVTEDVKMALDKRKPTTVWLENIKESRSIKLERFSADDKDDKDRKGLRNWNLGVFRYPEHPDFPKVKPVEKTKYLVLNFPPGKGEAYN